MLPTSSADIITRCPYQWAVITGTSVNKILSFIFKFLLALVLGLTITGFVMQRDPRILALVEQRAHAIFGKTFGCISSGKITNINLVLPTIELESVVVKNDKQSLAWHWSCHKATISFSWISVLFQRAFPLKIVLEDVRAQTTVTNGAPAIADYLKRLATPIPGGLPIFARELILKNVVAHAQDTDRPLTAALVGAATMRKKKDKILWNISLLNGTCWWGNTSCVSQLKGTLTLDAGKHPTCKSSVSCILPPLAKRGAQDCALQISCVNNKLTGLLRAGNKFLQIHATADLQNIPGTVRADVILPFAQFTVSADHRAQKLSTGIVDLQLVPDLCFTGSWSWDDARGLTIDATNHNTIIVPLVGKQIAPGAAQAHATINRAGEFALQGMCNGHPFTCAVHGRQYQATIDYGCIAYTPGQGTLVIEGTGYTGTVRLRDGAIKVAPISNYISELSAHYSVAPAMHELKLIDGTIGFHRGSITIPEALFFWDERFRHASCHVPLMAHDLFASWQKEFITVLNGELLLQQKSGEQAQLKGTILLDHAFVRGMGEQDATVAAAPIAPLVLDIRIMSRNGLNIAMPELDAKADVDIVVRKTSAQPEMLGQVKFSSGSLKLPYKPLDIISGMITYQPGQEPHLELLAKNKLRTYKVTLRANGPLYAPRITIDSSPPLTHEQIAALLVAPSFDVNKLNSYFKKLLRPLSRVRLVPSFIDETGRGGLRGAIEIEVSDQLSAVIEKNFSLPEDTKIKIDYAISDDVSLRGIRDERGDLGSEVEFRWSR